MKNNKRQFYIFNLEIATRKAGATAPSMNTLVPIFQKMKDTARTYPIRASSSTMLIGDLTVDSIQKYITLLVRLSDKTAPNSVYSDPGAGQFNEHLKTGNIGSDFGCHVLISTVPERGLPNVYTCAVERVQGISSDLVRRLLSKILSYEFHDDPTSFSYAHPAGGLDANGAERRDRCCPHINLDGRPSDGLINDINSGRISGVSLIKSEPVTPIAGAAFLKRSESELKLSVDHNSLPTNMWDSLSRAFQQHASTYAAASVRYRVPNSDRTVTVKIDTRTCAPLNDMYVKFFDVEKIYPLLAQSATTVVAHLRDLAAPKFLSNRNT